MITLSEENLFEIYHEVYKIPVGLFDPDGQLEKLCIDGGEGMTRMLLEDVHRFWKAFSRIAEPVVCFDAQGSVWGIFPKEDEKKILIGPIQTGENRNYHYRRIAAYSWPGFCAICSCFAKLLYGKETVLTEHKGRLKQEEQDTLRYDPDLDERYEWNSFDELYDSMRTGNLRTLRAILRSDEWHEYLDKVMVNRMAGERVFQFAVTKSYHLAQEICGATEELTLMTSHYLNEVATYKSDASLRSGLENMHYDFAEYIAQYQNKQYSLLINRALRYISETVYSQLTVDELASHCMVSTSTLQHQFKKETGLSVLEMIRRKKIEKACFFLKHTNLSCNDIALKMGYCSQSYFIAQFKKERGCTPMQWRKEK